MAQTILQRAEDKEYILHRPGFLGNSEKCNAVSPRGGSRTRAPLNFFFFRRCLTSAFSSLGSGKVDGLSKLNQQPQCPFNN